MADDARSREEGSTSESDFEDAEEEGEQVLEEREATVDHGEASVTSRDDSSSAITEADNTKSDDTAIGRNASMISRDESFTVRNTDNAKFDDTTIGQEASISSRDDSSIMTDADNSKSDDTAIGREVDGGPRNSEDNKSFQDFERERFEPAEEEHFEQVPLKDGEEGTLEQILGLDKVSLEEDSRMSTAAETPELDGGGEFITRTDEARSVDDRYKSQSPQHSSRPALNSFENGNGLSLASTRPPHVLPDASPELMHLIDSTIQESDSSSLGRLRAVLVGKERLPNDREEDAPEALVDVLLSKMRGLEGLEDSTYGSAPIVMLSARAATVAGKLIPWLPYGHDSESYTSPRTRLVNGLLMILKSCTRNRSMCAAAGLVQVLLSSADEIFKEKVDKFQEKQAWDPRPLCACLEVLAAHSLSVHDLRRWLEVVTHAVYTGRAQNLLLSLEKSMLGTETKGPSHTFEFDGESSGLLGPGESRWPFANGYAFVTWLYIESFADTLNTASAAAAIAAAAAANSGKSSAMSAAAAASALAGEGTAHMPRLFSFLSLDNQGVEAYFHGQFLVVECGTNKGKKASLHFTHAFQPRCWYFIGLEHVNKQGILGKSDSELKLYLNGQLFESRPFEFPRISKPLAFCCIGTNPPPTIAGLQRRRRQCPLFAEMGPIYIFKEPIGPERMLRLCFRGGDTIPSFGNSGLPSSARNELARALADESFSLDAEIEPRIHLLYHPKLLVGRSCPDASPAGQSGTHRRPAEILGHVNVAARCRAVEAMWAVAEGGILSLLPLTVSAVDKETYEPVALDHDMSHGAALLAASIFRMISVAVHHPGNSEELNWTHAPEMLSRLLHYLLAVLSNDKPGTGKPEARNEELVAAVVSLCQSPQSNFGLKVQLFTNLLLDLKIWSRCTYGLQKKLLSSLADMVFSEATILRTANAIQLLLDGCRQCYWVVRENDSVDTFAAGKLGRATGEVNALVDELLVIVELLVGYSTAPMAVNDVNCLIGFLLDCPQPNQVARVLHLIYRLIVQPNTLRAKMFAETFMSCGGIEMLLYLLRREAELGDQAQSDASNESNRKCEANEGDERDSLTSTEETKQHDGQIKVQGDVDSENIDNTQEKTLHGVHEKDHAPIRRLSSTDSQRMQPTREAFAGRNVGGISFSISPESARNNFYNVDSGDGILVGVIRLLGALVPGGQLKFSCITSPSPTSSPNFSGDQNQSEERSDAAVVNNSFVLFALQKAFQAAPSRLMTDAVYAALLGAAINISSTEDNHNLNLYDSGNKFEHIQLLLVLLRSLPYASRSLQLRAIQDILFLACSSSDNRNTLTSMPEWPEWLLEVLISNYERGLEELENGSLMTEVEDLVYNFLIIMLEHSMRQKDGWKDVEATLHCAEWLALIGGSSTGEQRVRREESLPVLKRRLLGGLMEFAARELQGQTQVIAAAAAGVAAGGLSPQVAKAEAESATYLSVALAENAIVLLMFVEDHLRFLCLIFNNSKAASGIVTPFSTLFSPVGRALSLEKEKSENAVYRRISSANESGGLPLDVLASMADENGQISASAMERLTAAAAAEPYESVRCAFLSYGSCASDLAEGWKRRSRMWYGVGLPSNAGGFGGGGSGWEAWGSAFEKDENGDWVELPLIKRSVAMLQALLLDESGLGSGLAATGGSGNLTGGMVALQQLLDSDQPFLTMLRMVLVAMREEDKGDESSLSNSISFIEDSSQMKRTAPRKPRSALLWSVLNPILSMSVSESRRQRILVAACILYAEVWHAVGTDRKPLRKQYLEMILPPFVALLRRWRPILCGIHDLTDPDGMNPLAIDERALAGDALPLEAALAMVTSGWAAAFASPPAAMALAMAAAGAGGEIAPPKGTHLRREMSILERRASKLRSLSSLQRVPDSPLRSSPTPKDKASAKAAALAAARDNERNAKIGSGRGLSAVAMATSAQRRGVGDRERVKRWNIFDAMVTAWLECSFSLGKQKIVERDFSGLVLKYVRALASMVGVAKELKQAEIDRRVVAAVAADYRTKVGSHAWRRMIRCLIEHEALFGPLTYQFSESKQVFWKLDFVENSLRMRRRLKRNYKGKAHVGAAANYGDFQLQGEDKREDTQDFSLKVNNSLTSRLPANATILPPEEYPLDEAHEEEGSSEICEEKYDLTWDNLNSPDSTARKDAATLDSIDAGTPKESIVADMPRAGTVVIEPDERMLLEIAAVMVQPLALVRGRFQVTTKRINFVLDESVDVGDAYNGNSDDRYENGTKSKDQSWPVSVLREVYSRRYLLRRSALELFMTDRSNFFFNFGTTEFRRKAYKAIVQAKPPYLNSLYYSTQNPEQLLKRTQLMERWARWEISNFEYLMQLNTLAGRSYNDITQYPVFPWILADYKSTTLDFNNPTIYRDLSKPVGALNPGRLEKFLERYSNFDDPVIPKFHYGSHYSSAGTVLYYLARVEPFTTLSIQLQGGKFDHADRLFSNIGATWDGVLEDMSDVKELVPELYYLPEVLTNENHVDFGKTQHGEKIDNVKLPPWARSPVDFINKHRTALESEHVSAHLHEWIDLIFGYKQRGKEAIDAHNLFFYVTYEGAVDIDKISDPVLRHATQDQIAYFGQTPSQLLSFPHIRRRPLSDMLHLQTIFRNPRDIKPYAVAISERCNVPASAICASTDAIVIVDNNLPGAHIALHKWQPNTPDGHGIPFLFQHGKATLVSGGGAFMRMFKTQAAGSEIWEFPRAIAIPAAGVQTSYIVDITPDLYVITGGHADNTVKLISPENAKALESAAGHCAPVTCLAVSPDGSTLVTGSRDSTAILWRLLANSDKSPLNRAETNAQADSTKRHIEGPLHVLRGHIGELTCCCINADLDLVVSCNGEGTILLHSISKGRLIRRLEVNHGVDIVSLSSEGIIVVWDKSCKQLETFTINGIPVSKVKLFPFHGDITCIEIGQDGRHAVFGTRSVTNPLGKKTRVSTGQENKSQGNASGDRLSSVTIPFVCLLDLHTLEILHILELQEGQDVTALALNKDNTNLVVSLLDKQLLIYTDPSLSVKVVDQMLRLGWQGDGLAPLISH